MRRPNSKRAISPIIATLLLILIAIAAGVVVYAYVIGFVGQTSTNQNVASSQLSSDLLSISKSTPKATLFLKNVGSSSANLGAGFYIKGGDLTAVKQLAPILTITKAGGTAAAVTDISLAYITDSSHVQATISTSASTVSYTITFLSLANTCTITNPSGVTASCTITLPQGVTVSTTYTLEL